MRHPFFRLLVSVALFSGCTSGHDNGKNNAANEQAETERSNASLPGAATEQKQHVATVEIKNMKFNPEVVTIHNGDTVVWVNNDLTNHCVTEAAKRWTSSAIAPGASWKNVVHENTDYYCAIHVVMKGRIKVE